MTGWHSYILQIFSNAVAGNGQTQALQAAGIQHGAHQGRRSTSIMQITQQIGAARFQICQTRGLPPYFANCCQIEIHTAFMRDG